MYRSCLQLTYKKNSDHNDDNIKRFSRNTLFLLQVRWGGLCTSGHEVESETYVWAEAIRCEADFDVVWMSEEGRRGRCVATERSQGPKRGFNLQTKRQVSRYQIIVSCDLVTHAEAHYWSEAQTHILNHFWWIKVFIVCHTFQSLKVASIYLDSSFVL